MNEHVTIKSTLQGEGTAVDDAVALIEHHVPRLPVNVNEYQSVSILRG